MRKIEPIRKLETLRFVVVAVFSLFAGSEVLASGLEQHFEPIEIVDGQNSIKTDPISEEEDSFGAEFGFGIETRFESSAEGNETLERNSPRFSLGIIRNKMTYQLQYGYLNESSRSGIFSIETQRREFLLLATYSAQPDTWWSPILGGGFGIYQDITTTRLSGFDSRTTESAARTLGQLFGG
ncbi:MAG: hypothetical protein AAF202_12470, partial [Pseudomonadota bacterium]